jgi:hypothetical protein
MNSGSFWLKSLRINIKPYRIKSPKLKLGDFFNLVSQNCFLQVKIPRFCKYFSPCRGGEFLCKPLQDSFQIFSTP